MEIYVIVVTYKGEQWYEKCFSSLRNSSIPLHIVAIDNASGDNTVEYIRLNFPEVHIFESDTNLGFGRANNIGLKYALEHNCDYVFLLNQDAWVEQDSIEKLVQVHLSHPEYGIVSPMHLTGDGSHLNFLIDGKGRMLDIISDLYLGYHKDLYPINYVNAAAWLLPRSTLMTIGGFCPIIFHYGEDDDYLNRAKFHKLKVGLCPDSRIYHDTKKRLTEGVILFKKANSEKIHEFLDINKSFYHLAYRRNMLVKALKYKLRKKNAAASVCIHTYRFLKKNHKRIEECRKQHMISQPSWLI